MGDHAEAVKHHHSTLTRTGTNTKQKERAIQTDHVRLAFFRDGLLCARVFLVLQAGHKIIQRLLVVVERIREVTLVVAVNCLFHDLNGFCEEFVAIHDCKRYRSQPHSSSRLSAVFDGRNGGLATGELAGVGGPADETTKKPVRRHTEDL